MSPVTAVATREGLRWKLARRRLDVATTCAALAVLLPTCFYRYGIDQALYHYVGAGWLEGRVPYRDAFDVKSPGIYAIYALTIALFGPGQSSIRIFEVLGVLGTARLIASTAGKPSPDGVFGLSALALATFHVMLFGFWDTAQAEFWESAFVVASYAVLVSNRRGRSAVAVAGVLAALATLMKPLALIALPVLALRAWLAADARKRPATLVRFALGFGAPLLLTVCYFSAVGAGAAFREWLAYLPHYAAQPQDPDWVHWIGPEMLLARCGLCVAVLGVVCLVAPNPWTLALALAAALGIVVQRRYFSYHAACLGPVLVLAAVDGVREICATRTRAWTLSAASLLTLGVFFGSPEWTGDALTSYRSYILHTFHRRIFGDTTQAAFDDTFNGPFEYHYAEQVAVAGLVKSRHPTTTDRLHVRGFDPTIYVLTGLYSPSRFLMESPVEDAYLRSYAPSWIDEHDRALFGGTAPRFFVARVGATEDLARLEAASFALLGSRGRYVVLERGLKQHRASAAEITAALASRDFEGRLLAQIPATATFLESGAYRFIVNDETVRGTYRVLGAGDVCLEPEDGTRQTCATIYVRDARFLAFDANGRELADLARARQ